MNGSKIRVREVVAFHLYPVKIHPFGENECMF